jgi:hypothetical protein
MSHPDANPVEPSIDQVGMMAGAVHEGLEQSVDVMDRVHADVLAEHGPRDADTCREVGGMAELPIGRQALCPPPRPGGQFGVDLEPGEALRRPQPVDAIDERRLVSSLLTAVPRRGRGEGGRRTRSGRGEDNQRDREQQSRYDRTGCSSESSSIGGMSHRRTVGRSGEM